MSRILIKINGHFKGAVSLCAMLVCVCCIFCCVNSYAEDSITIVYKNKLNAIQEYYALLKSQNARYEVDIKSLSDMGENNTSLIIAAGYDALNELLAKNVRNPVLSVFISKLSFQNALKNNRNAKNVSAIFSDPNPLYQFKLATKLYQKQIEVAVLLSDNTKLLRPDIELAAKSYGAHVHIFNVNLTTNLYKVLSDIAAYDVLLAVPDSSIYNRQSIRNILLTTYRHEQVVLGFSKGMVKAGALATTAVEVSDLANETKTWLKNYRKTSRLPEPNYSNNFNVFINEHVARSFNINVNSKKMRQEILKHNK